ncbi:MAG: homing endonuclease [Parcubacteria group bacterium Licking1014_1]|nr:MAG: homing endonuclease [Parcubacteria group bacterium Licking1014_1]
MDNTVGRLQSYFPPHQFDVLIGSLLGDARLECRSIGKRHPITARLRIHHSEKQKDYVFWKYEIFKDIVEKGPRKIMVWHDKLRNKNHFSWYFHSKSLENLGLLHKYFYGGRTKILPENVFDLITPRALAIWFMDDGSNTQNSYTISTHCFSEKEQCKILYFFKEKYNINAKVVKDRSKFKIAFGRHEYKKLNAIVEPYIIPSMIYKIVNPRNDFIPIKSG